ncbi:MAG: hypothetical protein JWQ02_2851 [Capsulimonas sp.]|nr:hypothetical protein [Capsulimonas sp.]
MTHPGAKRRGGSRGHAKPEDKEKTPIISTPMNIKALLSRISAEEARVRDARFLAPCVPGGQVRVRVGGLVQTFIPEPSDFEGWGVFQPLDSRRAALMEEASLPQVSEYLLRLPSLRVRLVRPLCGQTWLAYPASEPDMNGRLGAAQPILTHLVTDSAPFEQVIAHGSGGAWWFAYEDRRADPRHAEALRTALREITSPDDLRFLGLTPEMRVAYTLAAEAAAGFEALKRRRGAARARQGDTERLGAALAFAGGDLRDFQDRGEYWVVEWATRDGERHTSAIAKGDLTVISSGICLSDRDHDFDLQSLVGVIERRQDSDW